VRRQWAYFLFSQQAVWHGNDCDEILSTYSLGSDHQDWDWSWLGGTALTIMINMNGHAGVYGVALFSLLETCNGNFFLPTPSLEDLMANSFLFWVNFFGTGARQLTECVDCKVRLPLLLFGKLMNFFC
jgi:hypothetical protein